MKMGGTRRSTVVFKHAWLRIVSASLSALVCAIVSAPAALAQSDELEGTQFGRMIFTPLERRVLEAVRQGVMDSSTTALLQKQDIPSLSIPQVSQATDTTQLEGQPGQLVRVSDISVDWFIRNRSKNSLVIGLDGKPLYEDEFDTLSTGGLKLVGNTADPSVIEIEDAIFNNRILARRGTKIKHDGTAGHLAVSAGGRVMILKR